MPKKKKNAKTDIFYQGQYGLASAHTQVNDAYGKLVFLKDAINDQTLSKDIDDVMSKIGTMKFNKDVPKGGDNDFKFTGAFTDEKGAQKFKDRMVETKKMFDNVLKRSSKDLDKFKGYIEYASIVLDTDAGDYGRAMSDNPYLKGLAVQYINGPVIGGRISVQDSIKYLDSVDPVTNEPRKGPLENLNNYFTLTTELLKREYEKQKINDNYTPEKEKVYLEKLNQNFKDMLKNHEVLESFVEENGKSHYDAYLQSPLDTMARKNINDTVHRRTAKAQIEHIRGQQKAIDNGWGMNELSLPGEISRLAWYLEVESRVVAQKTTPEWFEGNKKGIEIKINEYHRIIEKTDKSIKDLEKELKEAKDSKADNKKITDIENNLVREKFYMQSSIKQLEGYNKSLANLEKDFEANKRAYERTKEAARKFAEFDKEVQSTKINCASDKIIISEKFNKIANECKGISANIDKTIREAEPFARTSTEYICRTNKPVEISQEILDTTITPEEYDLYGPFFGQNGTHIGFMTVKAPVDLYYKELGSQLYGEFTSAVEENIDDDRSRKMNGNIKYGMKRGALAPSLQYDINEEERKEAVKFNMQMKALMDDVLINAKGYEKEYNRSFKGVSLMNEVEKGNVMRALADRDYLYNFYTQLSGNAPEIHLKSNPVAAGKWMKSVGALEDYNEFCDAGTELFKAEFYKQRAEKSGWDDEKERTYLAKLDESMTRSINAFEKLVSLPVEFQEESAHMGNCIAHATGNDGNTVTRDIMPQLTGFKWMKEGIKLGYAPDELEILNVGGKIEGSIRRAKLKVINVSNRNKRDLKELKEQLKNGEKTLTEAEKKKLRDKIKSKENNIKTGSETLKAVEEFEEKKFKPLKESILSRKIESPTDVIKTVMQLQDFYDAYHGTSVIDKAGTDLYTDSVSIFGDTVEAYRDTYFPKMINQSIKKLEDIKKNGKKPEIDRDFKICDKSRELKAYSDALKENPEPDSAFMLTTATAYMEAKFLNGMNQDAHPEYFDSKHPDYIVSRAKLKEYAEQYAGRLIEVLDPKSCKEFAGILDNGNHNDFLSDAKERIEAEASRGRMNAFISGKAPRFKGRKTISEARKGLEGTKSATGSRLYDGIVSDLKKLEKMKEDLSRDILNQNRTSHQVKVVGYEKDKFGKDNPKKPIYEFTNPEEVKLDPKKLKAYKAKQAEVYKKMNQYIASKDAKITEKGGDPKSKDGAKLLGEVGEKRYKAMVDAKKSLYALNQATLDFEQNGISYGERNLLAKTRTFGVREEEYNKELKNVSPEEKKKLYDKFIAEEKRRFNENLKYNIISKNKEIKNDLAKDILNQDKARENLRNDFIAKEKPTEEEIKAYEDKIFDSAVKSVYSNTIMSNFGDKERQLCIKAVSSDFKNAEKAYNEAGAEYKRKYNELRVESAKLGRKVPEEMLKDITKDYEAQKKTFEEQKKSYENNMKDLKAGMIPTDVIERVQTKDILSVGEGLKNGFSKYVDNKPAQYDDFKQKIIENAPFKNEFRKRVIEASKDKNLNDKDILNIRDDILRDSAVKHEKNPEELQKNDSLSKLLGSKVKSEDAIKSAKQAAKEMKAAGKENEKGVVKP